MNSNDYEKFYDKYGDSYFKKRIDSEIATMNELIEVPAIKQLTRNNHYKSVLDIGCSFGYYSRYFAELGASVTGLDLSKKMLKIAEEYCKGHKIEFLSSSFENYLTDSNSKSFDLILGTFMIGYFSDLNVIFKKVNELLTLNGDAIFSMLHPILTSKLEKSKEGYILGDYFSKEPYKTDFVSKGKYLSLFRWEIEEILISINNNGLYLDFFTEPKLTGEVSNHIFAKIPSMIIFKVKKRN